ncbi:MAG: zinc ribbon domain-containing protein [Actinomycetota bacterium]|nr:zinc ribbon domain-containing protein [Actinomycetota bacterium]
MPIYIYKCRDCGQEFELLVGMGSSKEELKCKKCGSKNLERVFSAFGIGGSPGSDIDNTCEAGT